MSEENVASVAKTAARLTNTDRIEALEQRVKQLEERERKLTDIFFEACELIAEEVRPVFGWGGHVARLFQAIADRIAKELR